jgi:hypothetical protein
VLFQTSDYAIMSKYVALFALFFLLSCNTPETRLKRLQQDFWEKFAQQDFFEIRLKNEVLHLPLPYTPEQPGQQKTWAERLQKEAQSLEKEKLSVDAQKQLAQLSAALEDCIRREGSPLFDPSRCAISKSLQQYSAHPEISVLLEKIPAYYTQIEQRWQTPHTRYVAKAVNESQIALDLLKGLEETSERELGAQARGAIKDFIGLCQSAVLIK